MQWVMRRIREMNILLRHSGSANWYGRSGRKSGSSEDVKDADSSIRSPSPGSILQRVLRSTRNHVQGDSLQFCHENEELGISEVSVPGETLGCVLYFSAMDLWAAWTRPKNSLEQRNKTKRSLDHYYYVNLKHLHKTAVLFYKNIYTSKGAFQTHNCGCLCGRRRRM